MDRSYPAARCSHTCSFRITMPSSGVFKTIAEKLAVIAWIEEHGDGIPTWALKHFRDELNWKISGSRQKSATIVEEAVAPQSNGETEKTRAWRRLEARSSRSGGHYFSIKCSTSAPTKRRSVTTGFNRPFERLRRPIFILQSSLPLTGG